LSALPNRTQNPGGRTSGIILPKKVFLGSYAGKVVKNTPAYFSGYPAVANNIHNRKTASPAMAARK
jgi:hypothetical protein